MATAIQERRPSVGEEIANSLSHGAGLALAIIGTPVLITAAVRYGTAWNTVGGFTVGEQVGEATGNWLRFEVPVHGDLVLAVAPA